MSDEQSAVEEVDPFALFSEHMREPVEGLAYLGKLTDNVKFCGHTFGLRTLLPQDKLAISVVLQPYRNTLLEVNAFQLAHIGAALTSVDDDEGFCPAIGPDIEEHVRARLNWVAGRWYDPTVDFLWARYKLLEAKAAQGMVELDRLTQGSQPTTLPPWLDSLTVPGTSPVETGSDTQPSTPSS